MIVSWIYSTTRSYANLCIYGSSAAVDFCIGNVLVCKTKRIFIKPCSIRESIQYNEIVIPGFYIGETKCTKGAFVTAPPRDEMVELIVFDRIWKAAAHPPGFNTLDSVFNAAWMRAGQW